MRQRLAIIITITVVLVLLIALNTASFVTAERQPDTEFEPDRSTYNEGKTGTLAFYDLLAESGRKVMRWGENPQSLLDSDRATGPTTFVVIGKTRAPFEADEVQSLLSWVERGGQLVLIDRRPDQRLLPPSGDWSISTQASELPGRSLRPESVEEMTTGMPLVQPMIPSVFTRDLDAVLPSKFSGENGVVSKLDNASTSASDEAVTDYQSENERRGGVNRRTSSATEKGERPPISPAPVVYLEDHRGGLLVDYPHGDGRIVILSDPFIIANNGIGLADNLQLGINAVTSRNGIVAFDEYHQGRGATRNQLIAYFAGTPIMWMVGQAILIVLVILWTRGRRFARPLPVPRVDRRSSLEFVASMAELQQRARAYDLAIENIYTRIRRVLVRYGGLGHNSSRSEIATRVSLRSERLDAARLESVMRDCEDAINGAPLDSKKALALVRQLRMIERVLGLRIRSRETRQTTEGLRQDTL
jgi:hypothetical protein